MRSSPRTSTAGVLAPSISHRRHAAQSDGEVQRSDAPGPAEAMGDQHRQRVTEPRRQRPSDPFRAGIGILGQEQDDLIATVRPGVGSVDAGIGHDMPAAMARYQKVRFLEEHLRGFTEHQLDSLGSFPVSSASARACDEDVMDERRTNLSSALETIFCVTTSRSPG